MIHPGNKAMKAYRLQRQASLLVLYFFIWRMKFMQKTKKTAFTGLCVALGLLLPLAFHFIPGGGSVFLPMHIPVLLCGLVCGWRYGFACGVLAPLASHLMTGMPPSAVLPGMLCELAVYGVVSGLLLERVWPQKNTLNIYLSMIGAMLSGRIVAGIVKAAIFNVGEYSLEIWIAGSFIKAIPGILLQLAVIPVIVIALTKAGMVPEAYCGGDS